jgi:hypothetical protein
MPSRVPAVALGSTRLAAIVWTPTAAATPRRVYPVCGFHATTAPRPNASVAISPITSGAAQPRSNATGTASAARPASTAATSSPAGLGIAIAAAAASRNSATGAWIPNAACSAAVRDHSCPSGASQIGLAARMTPTAAPSAPQPASAATTAPTAAAPATGPRRQRSSRSDRVLSATASTRAATMTSSPPATTIEVARASAAMPATVTAAAARSAPSSRWPNISRSSIDGASHSRMALPSSRNATEMSTAVRESTSRVAIVTTPAAPIAPATMGGVGRRRTTCTSAA